MIASATTLLAGMVCSCNCIKITVCIRYELNKFLIGKAEAAGARIYFGHGLDSEASVFSDNSVNEGGNVGSTLAFDVVVDGVKSKRYVQCRCPVLACDGGGSRVRYAMKNQGLTTFTETLLGSDKYVLVISLLFFKSICYQ